MSGSQEMGRVRLHPTAEAIYRFVVRYKRLHAGESPTRREIGAGVGISTPSIVHHHLMMLERAGKIRLARPSGKARMIAIPGATWVFDEVGGQESAREANKCGICGGGEAADLPKEGVKVRERLGVFKGDSR